MKYDQIKINQILYGNKYVREETLKDIETLKSMIDWFIENLDEADLDDLLGTEGWRHRFGIED